MRTYSTCSSWGWCWALDACIQHYRLASGLALGPWGFLDTNMLASAMQIAGVGGRTNNEAPMRMGLRSGGI